MMENNGRIALDEGLTLTTGEHSFIHDRRIRNLSGSRTHITIGKYCSIAPDLMILGGDYHPEWIAMYPFLHELRRAAWLGAQAMASSPTAKPEGNISIGNDVWIGCGVKLFKGVKIGNGAVVGAGSSVTVSVEPYTIVAGVPAQPVQKRFSESEIAFLQKIRWWDWPSELINRRLPYLCSARFSELERIIEQDSRAEATKPKTDAMPATAAAQEITLLRARLGRMMGLSGPISEPELHAANLALVAAIKARNSAEYFAEHRSSLPAAMRPLLLIHLATAWAQGDRNLATALENLNRCLGEPQTAGIGA